MTPAVIIVNIEGRRDYSEANRMLVIREVSENDIDQWSQLRTALWPDTDDAHLAEINSYFAGTSNDMVIVYIAQLEQATIGFLELNLRTCVEGSRNPKVPYVEGWYIRPEQQGRGYGKKLLQQAERWAREKGYAELASDTEIDNRHSISIHKHLGFRETERIVCFVKNLQQE